MEILVYILLGFTLFMFGAALGSFFNVLLCRIPNKEPFVNSRSYCPQCRNTLKWFELVPVLSYVFLRGRCRSCSIHIKAQYLLMELFCGGSVLAAFIILGFTFEAYFAFLLFPVLVALSAEDIQKTEIPYWCTGTIAVLGIISTVLSVFMESNALWWEHLIGAVIISVPFAIFCFLGAMGGGDVQLTAAAGLLLGWAIIPSVLIAMIVGGVFGIVVKITRKRATICFGPFLSVGIAVSYLYGYDLISWYSSAFWY